MFKRRVGNRQGMALVEFALVLSLLLGLVGGAADVGLIFFTSHTVQNAAREGARFAVTLDLDIPTAIEEVRARVLQSMPVPTRSRFGTINVFRDGPNDCDVHVQVEGDMAYHFLRIFGFNSIRITREVTMLYERCDA